MDVTAEFLGGLGASLVASFIAYYEVAQIASDLTIAAQKGLAMPGVSTATLTGRPPTLPYS